MNTETKIVWNEKRARAYRSLYLECMKYENRGICYKTWVEERVKMRFMYHKRENIEKKDFMEIVNEEICFLEYFKSHGYLHQNGEFLSVPMNLNICTKWEDYDQRMIDHIKPFLDTIIKKYEIIVKNDWNPNVFDEYDDLTEEEERKIFQEFDIL